MVSSGFALFIKQSIQFQKQKIISSKNKQEIYSKRCVKRLEKSWKRPENTEKVGKQLKRVEKLYRCKKNS